MIIFLLTHIHFIYWFCNFIIIWKLRVILLDGCIHVFIISAICSVAMDQVFQYFGQVTLYEIWYQMSMNTMSITYTHHPKPLYICEIILNYIGILICFLLTWYKALSSSNIKIFYRTVFNSFLSFIVI